MEAALAPTLNRVMPNGGVRNCESIFLTYRLCLKLHKFSKLHLT